MCEYKMCVTMSLCRERKYMYALNMHAAATETFHEQAKAIIAL